MHILDKGALFLAPEKSFYKNSILFHKSFQGRILPSAYFLFYVTQVLISGKNSEGTLVYLIQFTAEERGQKHCQLSFHLEF